MTKLDWDKAHRDRVMARTRAERRTVNQKRVRDQGLYAFALQHELRCFSCNRQPVEGKIAKTGISKRGPWMICVPCVGRHKRAS